ncbi:hypothetical protein NDU88_001760 [Pleurodeles waltl]|uniref:Uncharacterized protein n=1 Tax=Pleurodeles waltl TaxID=8319 RepID=A0AAV7U9D3_PLEWA|nr:hypothetical protein NDU88_001760 [Pleurodeles waltl]
MVRPEGPKQGDNHPSPLPPDVDVAPLSTDLMLQDTNAKFAELLAALHCLKTSIEPKLDTLIIDSGHMHMQ